MPKQVPIKVWELHRESKLRNKIIAEIGSVHDGSFGNAQRLIEVAAQCGADVVKFQTHIAEAETLPNAPSPGYFRSESRWDYFIRTAFTKQQWNDLRDLCKKNGVEFLSSPFSEEAVDLLEDVGVDAYKIASGEVNNLPLLERIAQTGKTVYLSSGMSSWPELDVAVEALRNSCPVVVMQCTSAYPCPPGKVGLNVISEMRDRYALPVGFSDHTEGLAAGFAAAALGAAVIEKHLTFSKLMYGSDAANGTEPKEFCDYCKGIREIWTMNASPIDKGDLSDLANMKLIFQKSIVAAADLEAGTQLERRHLRYKKPGDGIPANDYKRVVGRTLRRSIQKDQQIKDIDLA